MQFKLIVENKLLIIVFLEIILVVETLIYLKINELIVH